VCITSLRSPPQGHATIPAGDEQEIINWLDKHQFSPFVGSEQLPSNILLGIAFNPGNKPIGRVMMKHRMLFLVLALAIPSAIAVAQVNEEAKIAFKDAHDKMMQAMMMEPSGDPDKDFAMMMIPHHQGAIDMAKVELQYGKDQQLRAMAEKIIAAQEAEIAELKKWQQEHSM